MPALRQMDLPVACVQLTPDTTNRLQRTWLLLMPRKTMSPLSSSSMMMAKEYTSTALVILPSFSISAGMYATVP